MQLENFTNIDLVDLIIIFLSVYRVSTMMVHGWETGPWNILSWFRNAVGMQESTNGDMYGIPGSIADMLSCYFCNSPWLGLLAVLAYAGMLAAGWPAKLVLAPLAASGFTVIVAKYTEKIELM